MRRGSRVTGLLTCLLCATTFFILLTSLAHQLNPDGPETAFNTLSNLDKFVFLMGKDRKHTCSLHKPPDVLILIHSAPQNRFRRDLIRQTWTSLTRCKAYFLLGLSPEYQTRLNEEEYQHKDIIQGNFIDTYKNLTYKHLMGLAWAVTFCESTKVILKVDDDTFVDTFRLLDVLSSLQSLENSLACALFPNGTSPVRFGSRRVTNSEFKTGQTYPPYCSGMAYLTSVKVADKLVKESRRTRFFWVDDVFVTGILAAESGVSHHNWIRWYSDAFSRDVLSWLRDDSDRKPVPYMFVEVRESRNDWTRIVGLLWNKTERSWNNVDV